MGRSGENSRAYVTFSHHADDAAREQLSGEPPGVSIPTREDVCL